SYSSRLDRVFTLLESGSSSVARKAAAKQLGDVQKKHPQELNHLLAKLLVYIRHNEWDTRIAAAESIAAVVGELPKWEPKVTSECSLSNTASSFPKDELKLTFDKLDVDRVLNGSQLLLSSAGEEYQQLCTEGIIGQDIVTKQRKNLEKRLGISLPGNATIGVSSSDLFNDDDLRMNDTSLKGKEENDSAKPVNVMSQLSTSGMSSRERNKAKRKAKLLMKQQSREPTKSEADQPSRKKIKKEEEQMKIPLDQIPEHHSDPDEWLEWPLEWLVGNLTHLLLSSTWEARHGACITLQQVLAKHGDGCGIRRGMTSQQMTEHHQSWLVDLAIRLLCVIMLDRFADYVSDQVVAPVRESCAQTLGVIARHLHEDHIFGVVNILIQLLTKDQWELRQGAMLCIQYIIAVKVDLQPKLFTKCLPSILAGLRDCDGDVKNVSAKSLLPITEHLMKQQPELNMLLTILWSSLTTYDELAASTQSILLLLCKLIKSLPLCDICQGNEPHMLVSRLLPFFHHALTCVKEAALTTMSVLIEASQNAPEWMASIVSDAMWNLLQCCLLEPKSTIRELSSKVVFTKFVRSCPHEALSTCIPYIPMWLHLAFYPMSVPIPPNMLLQQNIPIIFKINGNKIKVAETPNEDDKRYIGGVCSNTPPSEEYVMATREYVASLIGLVCCYGYSYTNNDKVTNGQAVDMETHLLYLMTSQSAVQRIVASIVVSQWWSEIAATKKMHSTPPPTLYIAFFKILEESFYFSEISFQFTQVQSDMKAFLATLLSKRIDIQQWVGLKTCTFRFAIYYPPHLYLITDLLEQCNLLTKLADRALKVQLTLECRVKAFASQAIVSAIWKLPAKLNPLIRPLMEGLKWDESPTIRNAVSSTLSLLIGLCRNRQPCPNPKLIKNLCNSMTSHAIRCPTSDSIEKEFSDFILERCHVTRPTVAQCGILTILRSTDKLQSEVNSRKRKRNQIDEGTIYLPNSTKVLVIIYVLGAHFLRLVSDISCGGATHCIQTICKMFGKDLFNKVPTLLEIAANFPVGWCFVCEIILNTVKNHSLFKCNEPYNYTNVSNVTIIIISVEIEIVILILFPEILRNLWHQLSSIRFLCSRCIAVLTKHVPLIIMPLVVEKIVPYMENSQNMSKHQGSVEAVANIIEEMGSSVVPYAILLIIPLLGGMSDQNVQCRLLATQCFGRLVQFMPVESGIPDPVGLPEDLVAKKRDDRRFLEQLFDNSSLDDYKIPVPINAKLRPYQEEGVRWLAFLNRYKLHGVLCDDMGLGKTLQTICILASDHHYKMKRRQENNIFKDDKIISLVVCPPTLTGHWVAEVNQFCALISPLHYAGNPNERVRLQSEVQKHNLVVASYEVVRNDIEFFSQISWNYCILDEGHAIKNGKSKLSQCIKSLQAKHRVILTGTPIQNSVLELWSLFDFLIPGLLGSEVEFNTRYSKPIIASREAKSSSSEQEEGLLAMEALHRQVLPFMLRRMKEDVLKDLPPKIIQDYFCDLSPLQLQLYEDFAKTRAMKEAESSIKFVDKDNDQSNLVRSTSHVFQALQYLQKVCNHPLLVLIPSHPQYNAIMSQLKKLKSSLHDIKHASKLTALQQLLLDCGIGKTRDPLLDESVANQHRALIFCQHRNLINIIENDLLRDLMPDVTYLRLDGGVPANQRYSIVSRFNNDPSIDVLLLTTKVGGLGLNLTGADTVIFVEHDWNPMVDLQAMDRAHRIGQKKVVNVYRVITRGTLEEKILGLQEFKLNIANTIVGDDNRGLQSMGTSEVLDLFNVQSPKPQENTAEHINPSKGLRAMTEGLGELWDQNQYDNQYNLDNFLQSLG
uniref:TATA-binding protein-associated factor 172 n=1 Tax=Ciona savignyi TaxID=51511 RepID=H2YV60_CIOSA